ncbi:hypothetical protein N2152v2_007813 [Parachlorella kessleri]
MGLHDMQQVDHLRRACAALYGTDPAHRRAADSYLKAARAREGFWVQAMQLLTSADSTPQEQFFAAHALRTAAVRAQDVVAPEPGQALAVRLAHLIVEAAACEQWLQAVLIVLAALPEACLSRDVSMHPDRRSAATGALAAEAAAGIIAEHALGQAAMPSCQLAALQLVQSWGALPAAAPALLLSQAVVGGMHEAVLASPGASTSAAEALAALYGACAGTGVTPASCQLLRRLLLFLECTVSGALREAAACQQQDPQRAMQLLNAGITLLSAAGAALMGHLCAVVCGVAAGLQDVPLQVGNATQQSKNGQSHLLIGKPQEQQQQEQQRDVAQLWEALGFVAGSLLELLQHPDVGVALAALQPWDESLLPGLDRMLGSVAGTAQPGQHGQQALHCQRAQQLLERLCGGLLQCMTLREGEGPGQATADARDLPADVRLVRKEGSESFRVAAAALGAGKTVAHLLDLSAQACTTWQARNNPAQGWQQLECCLYALNLVLPRHLGVQRQQGGVAAQQAQHAAQHALKLCQAALTVTAPKLAGTALTLLGGMPEALLQLPEQPGHGNQVGSEAQDCQAKVVAQLLATVLGLLECPDAKLSRNAATAVHRLTSNPSLAEQLVAQHAAWAQQLAQLYSSQGGLRQPPTGGEDLSKEEFMLRALCQLARTAWQAADQAQQGGSRLGMGQVGSQAGVDSLAGLVLRQAGALAQAAVTQLLQGLIAPGSQQHYGQQKASPAMMAAARQCGTQLEGIAVVLQAAFPPGAQLALEQAIADAWGTAQVALQLLPALQQQQQQEQQQQSKQQQHQAHQRQPPPYTQQLLLGCCHVVAAAACAAPLPTAQSALALLTPLLADPPHFCLLQALRAVVAGVVAAMQPSCSPERASEPHGQQASAEKQQQQQVLLNLLEALMLAFKGCSQHADDPEWSAPALLLGAVAARLLPQLQLPAAAASSERLTQQLLTAVRRGAQSYHRDVCEAALELAVALCCSIAVVQQSQQAPVAPAAFDSGTGRGPSAVPQADSVASQLVLALLLGAAGAMPPFMMMPVADALHTIWTAAALGELLGCGDDSKRFKRQLKVLCGGKKKGRHMDVPARGLGA